MSEHPLAKRTTPNDTCPYCGKEMAVEFGSFDFEESSVHQEATCRECGKEWQDKYQFVGAISDET